MMWESFCGRIGVIALGAAACLSVSCNHNPVDTLASRGAVGAQETVFSAAQQQLDVLWVVDNSGSMCQEQRFLGENFDRFVAQIADASLNFHLGVTTTHVPTGVYTQEPLARAGQLQSRPQPLPSFEPECRGDLSNGFEPVRAALAAAVACMQAPDAALTGWTDAQLDCVLSDRGAACQGVPDRSGDGEISPEDLFPRADEYRALPRFLRSSEYRAADGRLDAARLRADFACMALVGTRGTGYEKGLQAAIMAVSPELTAAGAPNEGFVRPEAALSVIFVTDENDCSNDGSIAESGNICGADLCDYWNSPQLEATSPLLKPQEFKARFMEALGASKGRAVGEDEVIMAGIFGEWRPYGGALPACVDELGPAVPVACADASDAARPIRATSGDRYERAIRQFANYYPNANTAADPLNFEVKETGWMCQGDFAPALEQIGRWRPSRLSCIQDALVSCASDADCPAAPIGGQAGRCLDVAQRRFCDTSLRVEARRVPTERAAVDDIRDQALCQAGSIGALPGAGSGFDPGSCVIDPMVYRWEACPAGSGVALVWSDGEAEAASRLTGYDVSVRYALEVEPEGEQAERAIIAR